MVSAEFRGQEWIDAGSFLEQLGFPDRIRFDIGGTIQMSGEEDTHAPQEGQVEASVPDERIDGGSGGEAAAASAGDSVLASEAVGQPVQSQE